MSNDCANESRRLKPTTLPSSESGDDGTREMTDRNSVAFPLARPSDGPKESGRSFRKLTEVICGSGPRHQVVEGAIELR